MRKPILLILLLVATYPLFSQENSANTTDPYTSQILTERAEKDKEMREDPKSPIPESERSEFSGLYYFPPDPSYRVEARLERFDNPFHFKMKTTTDRLPEYAIYGQVTFRLNGKNLKLNVYQNIELIKKPGNEDYLFIPFNDGTNGKQTYGGGRFLDAAIPEGDTLIIDFNKAYNPYCAYNHKYSCPIPPEENNLPLKIRAGEKKWHSESKP